MCTVSFLPSSQGFYVAMNRDEKRERFAGLPPEVVELESRRAVFPREPTGGTWISANDAGVCLALVNWHRIERAPTRDIISRGQVVRQLAGKSSVDEVAAAMKKLPLPNLRPFRLIAIAPRERRITEWRWSLQRLTTREHNWRRQHWFSSGFNERKTERIRGEICELFVAGGDDPGKRDGSRRDKSAGVNAAGYSLSWLRRLHRSHSPKRGPFSICMHRPDASTVSYTEIEVRDGRVTMRYKAGPACGARPTIAKTLEVRA